MLKDYYLEALEETQKSLQKGKQIWLTNASFLKEGNNSITLAFPSKMYLTNFNNFCKSELQSRIDSLTGSHIDIETIIGDVGSSSIEEEEKVVEEEKQELLESIH